MSMNLFVLIAILYNFLVIAIIKCDEGIDTTYFCKFGCKCVCNIDERHCRIYCKDPELIIDKTNLYDGVNFNNAIRELTINYQNWTELDKPIGKSDLELLDLCSNSISNIKSGVFKNQLNLKILRLNNNGLKYFDVDSFRVSCNQS